MLKLIPSCLTLARIAPKMMALGLSTLVLSAVPAISNAQEDLVIDTFEYGVVDQSIHDSGNRYYSSPVPRWYYSTPHANGLSGGVIAAESTGNKYLHFSGQENTLSMTWYEDGGGILSVDPARPFLIEFDLLNTTGESENTWMLVQYLMNYRYMNMGDNLADPIGYRFEVRVIGDNQIEYKLVHRSGLTRDLVPGSDGVAEVATGVFSTGDGNTGRPVRVSLEIFQNQQKLLIDGVEQFNLDIDPLPQNASYGTTGLFHFWSFKDQSRGVDNIRIAQFPEVAPEPVTAGEIYWADKTTVRTGESDGGNPRTVGEGYSRAIGVAVDDVNGKIYWTDTHSVNRSDLNGDNVETIYNVSGATTQGIAVNPSAGKIYWANHADGLQMADLDGSNVLQVISIADHEAVSGAAGVAIDSVTGEVYLSITANGALIRVQADGTGEEVVATLPANAYGLAVDSARNGIFYTIFGAEGTVNYLDIASGESKELASKLAMPLGIALTSDGKGLFWAEREGGRIKRAYVGDVAGLPRLQNLETIRIGEDSPFYIALTADATGPEGPPPFLGFLNGDFEADPYDQDWSVNIGGGAKTVAGIAPGSSTAVFIPNDGNTRLIQYFPQWTSLISSGSGDSVPVVVDSETNLHRSEYFTPIGPKWQFGLYFAGGTPPEAGNRSLNLILGHVPAPDDMQVNLATINFRINDEGGADAYSEFPATGTKRWISVFPAGTFEPSDVVDDQFVDPSVYYIQLDGDYSTENPFYTVSVARAGESEFFAVSDVIEAWQYAVPPAGSGIAMVHFHGFVQAPYVIDDLHLIAVGGAPEGYTAWAEGFFSEGEMGDAAISGPGADADGDGLSNLLEYALVGNPTQASTAEMPVTGTMEASGEVYLTITYTRPTETDVVYNVDASAELSGWMTGPIEVSSTDNGDGTTTVVYRDSVSIGDSSGRRFLRLRVSGE